MSKLHPNRSFEIPRLETSDPYLYLLIGENSFAYFEVLNSFAFIKRKKSKYFGLILGILKTWIIKLKTEQLVCSNRYKSPHLINVYPPEVDHP